MMKVFAVFTVSLLLLSSVAQSSAAELRELTVLTYNIHHGEGLDGKIDLERIAGIITNSKADLVALQEVDRNTKRSGGVDQARELARLTGMRHVFGRAIDYEGGEYGQAILARWPISMNIVHKLPQKAGREQRIALFAVIDGVRGLTFTTTHLDHEIEAIRIDQVRSLNEFFERNRSTLSILAGDFNAVPESEPMKMLLGQWEDSAAAKAAPTIPAQKPAKRIDYILFQPKANWRVVRSEVLNEPIASDHRPVITKFEFPNRE
jgi:endonuclease/exonuclease/phosphatase family metal-dependent hydrolase